MQKRLFIDCSLRLFAHATKSRDTLTPLGAVRNFQRYHLKYVLAALENYNNH